MRKNELVLNFVFPTIVFQVDMKALENCTMNTEGSDENSKLNYNCNTNTIIHGDNIDIAFEVCVFTHPKIRIILIINVEWTQ